MPNNYSLIIPSWYPTAQTPVNGIFIFKHVQLIAAFEKVQVLYATPAHSEQAASFQITEKTSNNFAETIVYFKPASNRALNQFLLLYAFWKGFRYIKNKSGLPSIVHNHVVFPAGFFALFISAFYRIPLLITEHWSGYTDEDGRYSKLPFVWRYLIRAAFKKAKGISVVSSYLKNALESRRLISSSGNILIVPNILNAMHQVKPAKENKTGVRALCIATLNDHEKNVSGLIEAVAIVVKQVPGFSLTIIGSGPERKMMEQKAALLNLLPQHIVFEGSMPNTFIPEYYLTHDFFILNSNFETFNIAAAEAIINGLPVVSTKCGGPEEFVNESNGILVEKGNTAQLAQAIKRMIETVSDYDPALISKKILERYSNDEVREKLKQLYSFATHE